MTTRFIAIVLAALLTAAGMLAFTGNRSGGGAVEPQRASAPAVNAVNTALAADTRTDNLYLGDFKAGYVEGFNVGVMGQSFPDQTAMPADSRGYLDGFSQGYTDGQNQQASLRSRLCQTAGVAALSAAPAAYGYSPSRASRRTSSRVLGDRYESRNYESRVDRGIGSTARKAMLIAGGAAVGAGVGGAVGGKKGALIGAAVGGGTGTALALTKKPSRAFNRKVSTKSVLTKTAIGAGAGALIGALAGGKKGALAGAAIGGGGGALWSVIRGKRVERRRR